MPREGDFDAERDEIRKGRRVVGDDGAISISAPTRVVALLAVNEENKETGRDLFGIYVFNIPRGQNNAIVGYRLSLINRTEFCRFRMGSSGLKTSPVREHNPGIWHGGRQYIG